MTSLFQIVFLCAMSCYNEQNAGLASVGGHITIAYVLVSFHYS
jgi:hypothetical protein